MFQTTSDDVIFSGHGVTLPAAGRITRVPEGVDFYMFGPPGVSMTDKLGQMLEGGIYISNLFITSPKTRERTALKPTVLTSDSGSIPNLGLIAPRNLKIAGMGVVPHIIGVEANTHLHDLWQRLKPFLQPNRKIRVIWGACSSIGSSDPSVDGE